MNSERVKKNIIINYRPAHPNSNCGSAGPSVFISTVLAPPGSQHSASLPLAFRETVAPVKLKPVLAIFLLLTQGFTLFSEQRKC